MTHTCTTFYCPTLLGGNATSRHQSFTHMPAGPVVHRQVAEYIFIGMVIHDWPSVIQPSLPVSYGREFVVRC